jgi:signal transduction histidine kinase
MTVLSRLPASFRWSEGWNLGARGAPGTGWSRLAGGLTGRTITVVALLSAAIGTAFLLLILAIDGLRDSERRAGHSLEVLAAINRFERLVIDIETTQRGFIIVGDPAFLVPWYQARSGFEEQGHVLERLAIPEDAGQETRVRQVTRAANSYVMDYAIPLVAQAQRDLDSTRTVQVTREGKERVDALRDKFEQFRTFERQLIRDRQDQAGAAAHRAIIAASITVAGSVALILFSGGYLARSVVRPVRRASAMAGRVAGGNLAVRMPESGPGEVGTLERSFNKMAGSLQTNSDELRRIVEEQMALRRVATLVARGVPPPEIFGAVAAETGRALGADCTAVARFEADDTATVVGSWARPGALEIAPPLGSGWFLDIGGVMEQMWRTGRPVRVPDYESIGGSASRRIRQLGIRSGVSSPITMEDHLWGAIMAFSGEAEPNPEGTEERLLAFTELVAMAVANTESRAELAASRARVVAAADETRRRIERDLHDGTQQRLISLGLELRVAAARVPADNRGLARQLSRTAQGLAEVVVELREISRGLHPAILERGGLGPALRALARRAGVPVELRQAVGGRLPERVEVAAYYVVSEALTNAAKHAHASVVEIDIGVTDQILRLQVRDDGAGGADQSRGSGLVGLSDRVEAAGGRIEITSPPGGGTTLLVTIPVQAAGRPGTDR